MSFSGSWGGESLSEANTITIGNRRKRDQFNVDVALSVCRKGVDW